MFTVGLRIYYTGRDGLSATWKSCCSFAVEFRGLQDPRSFFSAANYCKLPWKLASLFSFVLFLEKLRLAQFWTCWLASSVKPGGPDSVSRLWPMHCRLLVHSCAHFPVERYSWFEAPCSPLQVVSAVAATEKEEMMAGSTRRPHTDANSLECVPFANKTIPA